MIEILAMLLVLLGLAKHPKRSGKRRYSLRRVRVTPELPLLTLASDTVIKTVTVGSSDIAYRLISAVLTWTIKSLTGGDGPITVGFAHSDYTITEIKECLESTQSINQGNKISNEQANRLVRVVGTFSTTGGSQLNHGEPIKTRLNWLISIGDEVEVFAYNEGTGALSTGAVVNCAGSFYVKDAS